MTEESTTVPDTFHMMVEEFLELDARKRALEKELAEVKTSKSRLGDVLAEQFALHDIGPFRKSGMTIYRQRELRVSLPKENKALAVRAAHELGLDAMITLQPQSLTGQVREWVRDADGDIDGGVPESIRELINVTEFVEMRTRKSA